MAEWRGPAGGDERRSAIGDRAVARSSGLEAERERELEAEGSRRSGTFGAVHAGADGRRAALDAVDSWRAGIWKPSATLRMLAVSQLSCG